MRRSDDTTITMDDARALVTDSVLWPRIRDFLWDFAPAIHASWLETVDGLNAKGLDLDSPRLKAYAQQALGVEPCFHSFPKEDGSRLLLLDGETLHSLSKWLGALACAESLRKVTSGATVRSLRAALPGVYPDVFAYTAYFGKWKMENGEWKMEGDAGAQVCRLGRRILFSVLKDLPPALLHRLELKLPKESVDDSTPDSGNFQFSIFNFQFVAKLLKLKFPEAYSLCC